MSNVIGMVVWLLLMATIVVGPMAIFANSNYRAALLSFAGSSFALLILCLLGSGLVGPFDLRPMLVIEPVAGLMLAGWCYFVIRPRVQANG